jgi:hypothetical protein
LAVPTYAFAGSGNPGDSEVASFVVSALGESDRLLERERELERVGRILRRVEQGHGRAVVVEGPAGLLEGPPEMAVRVLGLVGRGDGGAVGVPVASGPSFAALDGLYWLCANLAAEGPLALVVDGAHWADVASLRFLAFLLPRLEEPRVAVLLGARPAECVRLIGIRCCCHRRWRIGFPRILSPGSRRCWTKAGLTPIVGRTAGAAPLMTWRRIWPFCSRPIA